MIGASTRLPPIQRLVEIKTVAEQLQFKISTLLLHGGKIIEAVKWFRRHIASYKPLEGSPEVIFFHSEWLSRQFLVFAELLETSSATIQSPTSAAVGAADRPSDWEFYPAYYYQVSELTLIDLHFLYVKLSAKSCPPPPLPSHLVDLCCEERNLNIYMTTILCSQPRRVLSSDISVLKMSKWHFWLILL